MIPGYTDALAKELDIVKERVAIRGQEVMQSIVFEVENPRRDSMMVTPIGICLSYYEQSNNFIFVEFNGRRVKLYDNGKLSVADAAVQSDFSNEDLFPRRGKALTFTVNGKSRMVRGIQGEAAVIRVNGEPADIYSQVHNGDHIDVVSSTAGDAAVLELGRLPELTERLHVYVNGTRIDLPKTAAVNGRLENEFYSVREGDEIRIQNFYTVREVAEFMDVPLGGKILVNDTPARPETRVYENFTLSWDVNAEVTFADLEEETEEEAALRRAAKEAAAVQEASVSVDGAGTAVTERQTDGLKTDGRADTAEEEVPEQGPVNMTVIVNRYPVICSGKSSYVFVDVFSFIDFDLNASAGRAIVTKLNGRNAEYMEPLKDGDVIEIYWEELNS